MTENWGNILLYKEYVSLPVFDDISIIIFWSFPVDSCGCSSNISKMQVLWSRDFRLKRNSTDLKIILENYYFSKLIFSILKYLISSV